MNRPILGLAALLATVAIPATAAEFDHIASVTVGDRFDRQTQLTRFGGPVDELRLQADGDVRCDAVTVNLTNGSTMTVFSGTLNDGEREAIRLPGGNRDVRSITFDCRSLNANTASIDIAADTGDLPRFAARQFPGYTDHDYWMSLGHETFGTTAQDQRHMTSLAGRDVQALGFEAVGSDARCMRAIAHYDNGDVAELNIRGADVLREGLLYRIELPGERDVHSVDLMCRAVGDDQVTINLYGNKDELAPAG